MRDIEGQAGTDDDLCQECKGQLCSECGECHSAMCPLSVALCSGEPDEEVGPERFKDDEEENEK